MEAIILADLAWLARLRGEPEEALERAGAALSIYEDLKVPQGQAYARMEAALAQYEKGERAAAVRDAERAREIYASLGDPREREVEEQLTLWREEGHA